jgi:hypothetical protein
MVPEAASLVRTKLVELGWTQGDLRREMASRGEDVPVGLICHWLKGRRIPSVARASLVDEILGGIPPRLWTIPSRRTKAS